MAGPPGFEPGITNSASWCLIHARLRTLQYSAREKFLINIAMSISGGTDRIRTGDAQLRRLVPYPC